MLLKDLVTIKKKLDHVTKPSLEPDLIPASMRRLALFRSKQSSKYEVTGEAKSEEIFASELSKCLEKSRYVSVKYQNSGVSYLVNVNQINTMYVLSCMIVLKIKFSLLQR